MFLLKTIITNFILPPLGPLLVGFFGLWLARRHPRTGHGFIALGLVCLALVSMPWVSSQLLDSLVDTPPIDASELGRAQAIVTLGGQNYQGAVEYGGVTVSAYELERLRYTARLAKISGLPVAIAGGTVDGGEPESITMRKALAEDFGVQTRWIETTSTDTIENAANLAPILKQAGIQRIALVTHIWHMSRARKEFELQGFQVFPAPTGFQTGARNDPSIELFLPNADSLADSRLALHEWLGKLYVRLLAELPTQ